MYDDELVPLPSLVHASIALEEARAHFNIAMAEELHASPVLVFSQEDQSTTCGSSTSTGS